MSEANVGSFLIALLAVLASAHLTGFIFERVRQPRLIGEIAAGILLGPSLFGHWFPHVSKVIAQQLSPYGSPNPHTNEPFGLLYWLGLLLLMFVTGAETRSLSLRSEPGTIACLAVVGTGLPFVIVLLVSPWLPLDALIGPARQNTALLMVIGIAVAVTSIPVISRMFFDLNILDTRFARLVLAVAMVEDIILWGVLAVATALAGAVELPTEQIVNRVLSTLAFFAIGLTLAPRVVERLAPEHPRVFSPISYFFLILLMYCGIAARLHVSLVFAAFLAGLAVPRTGYFSDALLSLRPIAFGIFIPTYFALVGFTITLGESLSLSLLAALLVGACVIKLVSVTAGARLAGFRGLEIVNLAITTNARGGPGIVLASVAFEAGIVNAGCYTALVTLAVLTSHAAGAWLAFVTRRGWPLLRGRDLPLAESTAASPISEATVQATWKPPA